MRLHAPAAERNAAPILDALRTLLPARGTVLEVASGTGQHVATFAAALGALSFVPSDLDTSRFDSIRAWTAELGNVAEPVLLDVTQTQWPVDEVDAVFCANMVHIAPPEATEGLLCGVGRHLRPGGRFMLYGPFTVQGQHTAPSNAAFDASLRARDPRWGVRDVDALQRRGEELGLALREAKAMPANNMLLVFGRRPSA